MNIFGIDITVMSAKEVMKKVIDYLNIETISTMEIVTLEMLMREKEDEEWKRQVKKLDMLLPAEKELFEAAKEVDRNVLRELENQTFLKMFFRYLQKNKKRLFLLAETKEELHKAEELLKGYARGLSIVGRAVLPKNSGLEHNVINEINGVEPDCIFSVLPSPDGERFIVESRALLNARLWAGGASVLRKREEKRTTGRIGQFILKKIFRYQVEKQKTTER